MRQDRSHTQQLDECITETRRYYERDLHQHTGPEPEHKNPLMQLLVVILILGFLGGWPLLKLFLSMMFWPLF